MPLLRRRTWILVTFAILSVLAAAVVTFWLLYLQPTQFTTGSIPEPNGDDHFERAADILLEFPEVDLTELDDGDLLEFLQLRRDALDEIRIGLNQPESLIVLPTLVESQQEAIGLGILRVQRTKSLLRLLDADLRHAIAEERFAQASLSARSLLRLSQMRMRGGIMLDRLACLAFQQQAIARILKMAPSLDRQTAEPLLNELVLMELTRESAQETLNRERAYLQSTQDLGERFADRMMQTSGTIQALLLPVLSSLERAIDRARASTRLTAVALAIESYRGQFGDRKLPEDFRLDLLSPDYLPSIPTSPYDDLPIQIVIDSNLIQIQGADYLLRAGGEKISVEVVMPEGSLIFQASEDLDVTG